MLDIEISTALKMYFRKTGKLSIALPPGATIRNLVDYLSGHLCHEPMEDVRTIHDVRRTFYVLVDGRFVGLDDAAKAGSRIMIVPPIFGG